MRTLGLADILPGLREIRQELSLMNLGLRQHLPGLGLARLGIMMSDEDVTNSLS